MKTSKLLLVSALAALLLAGCKKESTPDPQPDPPVLIWDGTSTAQPADYTTTPGTVHITSAPELAWISEQSQGEDGLLFEGYSFVLTADIDLNNKEWVPVGKSPYSNPRYFMANFDGGNHTISNLKVSDQTLDYAGLLRYATGTIKDLRIASGSVSGNDFVGSICGFLSGSSASLQGCTNAAAVTARSNVGGLAGRVIGGATVSNCSNSGNVTATKDSRNYSYAGGICGYAFLSTFTRCTNSAAVTGTGYEVGGICGQVGSATTAGTITGCLNTGAVTGDAWTGGICGTLYNADSRITACKNTGAVTGDTGSGGVCGLLERGPSVIACYNTGTLSLGNESGGVCGPVNSNSASVIACYNTATVNASSGTPGGVAGTNVYSSVTACYYKQGTATVGVGAIVYGGSTYTDTKEFASAAWPATGTAAGQSAEWGVGDGSGSGKYWKSLGSWNGGTPTYPTLWWE